MLLYVFSETCKWPHTDQAQRGQTRMWQCWEKVDKEPTKVPETPLHQTWPAWRSLRGCVWDIFSCQFWIDFESRLKSSSLPMQRRKVRLFWEAATKMPVASEKRIRQLWTNVHTCEGHQCTEVINLYCDGLRHDGLHCILSFFVFLILICVAPDILCSTWILLHSSVRVLKSHNHCEKVTFFSDVFWQKTGWHTRR